MHRPMRHPVSCLRAAALPLALPAAFPAAAQVVALNETVVTATRGTTRADELVSDVRVIDRDAAADDIRTPLAVVAVGHLQRARIVAVIGRDFGNRRCVAQSEIEALCADRRKAMRGLSDQGDASIRKAARGFADEGKCAVPGIRPDLAEDRVRAALEFAVELLARE